ncbi:5'-AMP-activated protein kinase, regulatory gamma subunit [Galdieria sulphuraria]|uniref:5'-AMP-activated protein kinase, regulatory gamma subunit n=1 Tax=Galdieria sulphuraria TaxID=130081 RepID=M2W5H3_GALSU|nr:5'-AMP-activated protein kinase, regulatory gamma subunit [Galdieria sulphuraria]EME31036.1 5'-AMP-activated protein kinase, regulatory gamma subunit [Galdieria sulphuraria]|eukprot:XP_005707556.1 5'-AMP-activated protein kinase, regulatory gamma subunit [Galdieria sulphuraria]
MLPNKTDFTKARKIIASFLRQHRTSEVVLENNRVVVLEADLPTQVAFTALLENDIRGAPLWDNEQQRFVGMITSSDLVDILYHCMEQRMERSSQFKSIPLTSWKDILYCPRWHRDVSWIYTEADSSLYDSCHILKRYAIHKLPVLSVEDNLVVHILTHSRILSFVHQQLGNTDRDLEALFSVSVQDLCIGTWDTIYTTGLGQSLENILSLFHERNVSAVPVVDQNGMLQDLFARSDVCHLARNWNQWNWNSTIESILSLFRPNPMYVYTCFKTDSLRQVFDKFCKTLVHRLFVVDENRKVIGVISLSDLLGYFLE